MRLLAGWRFPWAHAPRHANPAAPTATRGRPGAALEVPLLELVRDWLSAQGARPRLPASGVLTARLAGGATVTYTTDALFAREHPGARLLAPGTPARAETLAAMASGAGGALRIPAREADAAAIARSAITLLDASSLAAQSERDPEHVRCVACLEQEGRLVIIGAEALRSVRLERASERTTIEAAISLSVRTHRGLREEVARCTVDAATGASLAPLHTATLRSGTWHEVPQLADSEQQQAQLALAAAVQPLARAAGHLARLQSLADYHRRQADIARTSERQLIETPDDGRTILAARQSELDRLAAAHGVNVTSRARALTVIVEPLVDVQVALRGGGAITLRVDLARQRLDAPACPACAQPWRIGIRCAEGHITCLACQVACAHCGARWCPRCSVPAPVACAVCGGPACARCAAATARGRHRPPGTSPLGARAMAERALHAPPPATGGTHALTAADLDAMSPATWLALVRWYLETSGYRLDRAIEDQHAGTMSFACHQADGAADVAVTPLDGSLPASEHALLARRLAGERKHRQDGQLIVITRQSASHLRGAYAVLPQARLVDRAAILAHMTRQAEAFSNAQSQMDDEMDARATAARAVQATLRAALLAAAEALTRPAHRAAIPSAEGATTVAGTERDAQVLRQIMLACETLAEDWSSLFAATPTRNNALAIERDTASIAALAERVGHLGATLRQVVGTWSTPAAQTPRALQRWRAALAEEAALHCRLISAKLEAIDPAAWRDFEAARPSAASGAVAEAQAAWQRASLRARRLADESVAPAPQAPARAAPHP